jgi:hypothetical protein
VDDLTRSELAALCREAARVTAAARCSVCDGTKIVTDTDDNEWPCYRCGTTQ